MIDIVPRRVLPKRLAPAMQQDVVILISSCLCLSVGIIWAVGDITIFSDFKLVHLLANIRQLVHPAQFPCPFCGGTRSFLCCCRGEFFVATQYSIPGVIVFCWIVINLPLRATVLLFPGLKNSFKGVIATLDSSNFQIMILLSGWLIQLTFHLSGIMAWYPAVSAIPMIGKL